MAAIIRAQRIIGLLNVEQSNSGRPRSATSPRSPRNRSESPDDRRTRDIIKQLRSPRQLHDRPSTAPCKPPRPASPGWIQRPRSRGCTMRPVTAIATRKVFSDTEKPRAPIRKKIPKGTWLPLESYAVKHDDEPEYDLKNINVNDRGYAVPSNSWNGAQLQNGRPVDENGIDLKTKVIFEPCIVKDVDIEHGTLTVLVDGCRAPRAIRRFCYRKLEETDDQFWHNLAVAIIRKEESIDRLKFHLYLLQDLWNPGSQKLPHWLIESVLPMLGFPEDLVADVDLTPKSSLCFREFTELRMCRNLSCSVDGNDGLKDNFDHASAQLDMRKSVITLLQQVYWYFNYAQILSSINAAVNVKLKNRTRFVGLLNKDEDELLPDCFQREKGLVLILQNINTHFIQLDAFQYLINIEDLSPEKVRGFRGMKHVAKIIGFDIPMSCDEFRKIQETRRKERLENMKTTLQPEAGFDILIGLERNLPDWLSAYEVEDFSSRFLDFIHLANFISQGGTGDLVRRSLRAYVDFFNTWIKDEFIEYEIIQIKKRAEYYDISQSPLISVSLQVFAGEVKLIPALEEVTDGFLKILHDIAELFDATELAYLEFVMPGYGVLPRFPLCSKINIQSYEQELQEILKKGITPIKALIHEFREYEWVFELDAQNIVENTIMKSRTAKVRKYLENVPGENLAKIVVKQDAIDVLVGFFKECEEKEAAAEKRKHITCVDGEDLKHEEDIQNKNRQAIQEEDSKQRLDLIDEIVELLPYDVDAHDHIIFVTEEELGNIEELLVSLENTHKEIKDIVPSTLKLSFFNVDTMAIKAQFDNLLKECKKSLLQFCVKETISLSEEAINKFTSWMTHMKKDPEEMQELIDLIDWINNLDVLLRIFTYPWYEFVNQHIAILEKYSYCRDEMVNEVYRTFFAYMAYPHDFKVFRDKRLEELEELRKVMAAKMCEEMDVEEPAFAQHVKEILGMIDEVPNKGCELNVKGVKIKLTGLEVDAIYDYMEKMESEIENLNIEHKDLNRKQLVLRREVQAYTEIEDYQLFLQPFNVFWFNMQEAYSIELIWIDGLISELSHEEMRNQIDSWKTNVTENELMCEVLSKYEASNLAMDCFRDQIIFLESVLPILAKISHPGFLRSTWELLAECVHIPIEELNPDNLRLRDLIDKNFIEGHKREKLDEIARRAVAEYDDESHLSNGFDVLLLERWTIKHGFPVKWGIFKNKVSDVIMNSLGDGTYKLMIRPKIAENKKNVASLDSQIVPKLMLSKKIFEKEVDTSKLKRVLQTATSKILLEAEEEQNKLCCYKGTFVDHCVLARFEGHPVILYPHPILSGHCQLLPYPDEDRQKYLTEEIIYLGICWSVASQRRDFRVLFDSEGSLPPKDQLDGIDESKLNNHRLHFFGAYFGTLWDTPNIELLPVIYQNQYGGVIVSHLEHPFCLMSFSIMNSQIEEKDTAVLENLSRCVFNFIKGLHTANIPYHVIINRTSVYICGQKNVDCFTIMGLSICKPKSYHNFTVEDRDSIFEDLVAQNEPNLENEFESLIETLEIFAPDVDETKLDGSWTSNNIKVGRIMKSAIYWPRGNTTALIFSRASGSYGISVWFRGTEYVGQLVDNTTNHLKMIQWSDGDVWFQDKKSGFAEEAYEN